ncbi:MAG: T9SS type A sorting domain-containing protein [Candidatus Krumholzibacteria bacterium]|nr:T9SS type A sorting domain-containing protein [Candidatus Krumholzibacteria bacterium]
MKKFTCSLALLVMGLSLMPVAASAQLCPAEGPQISVYFDAAGTQRTKESPGIGVLDEVFVWGEGFPAPFLSGVQYKVDYGTALTWLGDLDLPGAVIGSSPVGIAMGFGAQPRPGVRFLIQRAFVLWNVDAGCASVNVDGPAVVAHPTLGPVAATVFPSQLTIEGDGGRSQICQSVEMDIAPGSGSCPAPVSINLWKDKDNENIKGRKIKIAVLGTPEGVDAFDIDMSSLKLGGAVVENAFLSDVAAANQSADCIKGNDGRLDLVAEFRALDAIAGIPVPNNNDLVELTVTGCYIDGLPFKASNVVRVVGNLPEKFEPIGETNDGDLSLASPNPFNPVTRFSYSVPSTQHVRLAVYDVTGRLVQELVNSVKSSGEYLVEWDAGTLPSGVYFYRLETGSKTIVRRATLLK